MTLANVNVVCCVSARSQRLALSDLDATTLGMPTRRHRSVVDFVVVCVFVVAVRWQPSKLTTTEWRNAVRPLQ